LAAEQLLQARLLNVGVAKADRFPTLGLFGTVGQRSIRVEDLDQGDAFTWGISGNLLGPVIDFGKRRSVVELAQAQVIEAKENYEKLALVAVQETENSYTEINTYLKEYEKRTKQIKAASHAALLSRARYDQGFTSYLEVLNIERSLFSAELNSQITYKNYLQSIVRLYKSLGGGWKL
jgi:multidrug efflux system outer membrane protein